MRLVEYLYVDERRLCSYFEQISGPVHYDKVPSLFAGIGLAGPRAEAAQTRHGRPFTTHEKVRFLCDHLRKNAQVYTGRPWRDESLFCFETCRAMPLRIPPQPQESPQFKGLRLWVSPWPGGNEVDFRRERTRGSRPLYLLEDAEGSDTPLVMRMSSYSLLRVLFKEYRHDVLRTTLAGRAAEVDRLPEYHGFASGPTDLMRNLCRWGAMVGDARFVTVLYRVRRLFGETFRRSQSGWSVFAYPILIVEGECEGFLEGEN